MVDSLISLAIDKLNKVLDDEVALLFGVTEELQKLSSTFTAIKAVLEDAERRRLDDSSVKDWLQKLKDVAYDIDDILDEWTTTEALRSRGNEGDPSHSCNIKVMNFLSPSCFDHVVFRHRIGNMIKDAWERLEGIERQKQNLNFAMDNPERPHETRERETSSHVDESTTVGRKNERDEIVKLLLNEVNKVPTVISIVGMGGVGKTTLAQLAYNDKDVKAHFAKRIWVSVSEDFDVKQITKSILESATGSSYEKLDLDLLLLHLREALEAKRFLLVLDDIWSEDAEKWDKLKPAFLDSASGSQIVITTRSEQVASAMENMHMYKLNPLSYDDCWSLFSRKALDHRTAEDRSELEKIGRDIVKKCGGVPLAAKTIGSVMRLRKTRRQWQCVLESSIWNSVDILRGILPALLLSYHDLPPALKQCFTYCSIFPKDWEIEKDMIVKLWVAQGFICSGGGGDMEETGGLYFDELSRRSLLQDAKMDSEGNILSCKMHDLVHDLAQFVAGSDCSMVEVPKQVPLNLNDVRHFFLFFSDDAGDEAGDKTGDKASEMASISATLFKANKLRTLLLGKKIYEVAFNLFHHWRHLRALDLGGSTIEKLPPTLGQLKHLRYLNLSHTSIVELPEEACNCRNLQTLRLNGCGKLRKLPRGMPKMISLRHLELEGTSDLRYLPRGLGRLTGLRTLTDFIAGGSDEGCKCRELKQLNHLQGSFLLRGLENVKSNEAREAELSEKQQLHALSLQYPDHLAELSDDKVKRMDNVLQSLRPHTNLKEFEIQNYPGSKLPSWIEDPVFSNLVKVKLQCCHKCKQLPGFGKLPFLKYLQIGSMKEVEDVGGEFSGGGGGVSFPKLETLIFWNMPNWKKWELRGGDGQVMPLLLELKIQYCRELMVLPYNLPPLLRKVTLNINKGWMSSGVTLPVLPNLDHLVILSNSELNSLPCDWLGQLRGLKTLEIRDRPPPKVGSLPKELQHLTLMWRRVPEDYYRNGEEDWDKIAQIPCVILLPSE